MASLAGLVESRAPLKEVKRVQFGILSPDEIVRKKFHFSSFLKQSKKKSVLNMEISSKNLIRSLGQLEFFSAADVCSSD